jgi:hypothetical protein
MQHLDEGTIHAWLDGELPADEAERIAVHVGECVECGALVAEARGLIAASTRILTALDDVPAGVMPSGSVASEKPARPGGPIFRRHWYDRTDFRAAAALLFVAGASLVAVKIARNPASSVKAVAAPVGSSVAVSPVLQDTATPAAADVAQQAKASEVKPIVGGAGAFAERARSKGRVAASPPTVSLKVAAREPASAPAMANAMDATGPSKAMAKIRSDAPAPGRVQGQAVEGALEEVVVTGVATGATAASGSTAPLRVLRADSTADTWRVVYQVSPGVEVTLVESAINAVERDLRANQQLKDKSRAAAPAPMVMSASAQPQINTISWSDLTRRYTLSGPLKPSELEAIKERLMKMRR